MTVNDKQIGGDHYKIIYQHWDFMFDCQDVCEPLPWTIGCATKFMSRWRKKNGVEDLEKVKHYLEKAKSNGDIYGDDNAIAPMVGKFAKQFNTLDASIIEFVCYGFLDKALLLINDLILKEREDLEAEKPSASCCH